MMDFKKITLWMFCFCALTNSVVAQEDHGLYTELTFASRSIFHGWDIAGDNNMVMHPYIEDEIGTTGLSVAFWASLPIDRSLKAADDLEFYLIYGKSLFPKSAFKTDLHTFADFIICPNTKATTSAGTEETKMLWKYKVGLSFNELMKISDSPLVPGYTFFHFRPFGDIDFKAGSVHELSLYYTLPVLDGVKIGGAANYHTGAFGGEKGWTHATSSVSTSKKAGPVNISASVNYQWSFDVRADVENEFWMMLGINKSF